MIAHGISGTIKWTLDEEGTLFFEPVSGDEGTFADYCRESYDWKILYFNQIKRIKSRGKINLAKNSSAMFQCCSSLTSLEGLENWNTKNVTNMSCMFFYCTSLININSLRNWNTSNVTNMDQMFQGCSSLTDISVLKNWNMNNVTNTNYMFDSCSSLKDKTFK